MTQRYLSPEAGNLARALDAIARYAWRGLPALKGNAEPPKVERLDQLFREIKITEPLPEEIIKTWPEIIESVKVYRTEHAQEWQLYEEYLCRSALHVSQWGRRSVLDTMSEKYDSTPFVIRSIVKEVPRRIAQYISMREPEQ